MPKRLQPNMASNLLTLIDAEYNRLMEAIAPLTDAQMIVAGAVGESSVKDVLAHLAAWERRLVQRVRGKLEQGADLSTPAFNAQIHQQNKERSLREVRAELKHSHTQVLKLAAGLSPAEQEHWKTAFKFNTYSHYKWATEHIRRWMRSTLGLKLPRDANLKAPQG